MDCRPTVHAEYAARIDAGNELMAWGAAPRVNSWYKSDSGKIAQNWPFSLREFWEQTRSVRTDDYEVI
jgi:4-hydroxyacetophenone monooxygenase